MNNRLVAGIGVYKDGRFSSRIGGNKTKEYLLWNSMLIRCQPNGSIQTRNTSYVGCSVHPDFIHFQDFAEWCNNQIGFGNHGWDLEKDILVPGNKVYGPDTCCFVPKALNQVFAYRKHENKNPGVSWYPRTSKYRVEISRGGVRKTVGYYSSIEDASASYKSIKFDDIHRNADLYQDVLDPRVYSALKSYTVDMI